MNPIIVLTLLTLLLVGITKSEIEPIPEEPSDNPIGLKGITYQIWTFDDTEENLDVFAQDVYNKTGEIWILNNKEVKIEEFNYKSTEWDLIKSGSILNIDSSLDLKNEKNEVTKTLSSSERVTYDYNWETERLLKITEYGYIYKSSGETYFKVGLNSIEGKYVNQSGGSAYSGTTVCKDLDDTNAKSDSVYQDKTFTSSEKQVISRDNMTYVSSNPYKAQFGSGTDCCGMAENQGATSCSGYSQSDCLNYLSYTPSTGLFTKCNWISGPNICVPMLPCKTFLGTEYTVNISNPEYITSLSYVVRSGKSAFRAGTDDMFLYTYDESKASSVRTNLIQTKSCDSNPCNFTGSINIADINTDDDTLSLILVTSDTGGNNHYQYTYYINITATYNDCYDCFIAGTDCNIDDGSVCTITDNTDLSIPLRVNNGQVRFYANFTGDGCYIEETTGGIYKEDGQGFYCKGG